MLIDSAEIYVRSGKGGDGCLSFRREKYIPRGGPDGGDGGDGADVYVRAAPGIDTLLDFVGKHHWKAENGQPGRGKEMTGKSGEDLYIDLPPGTLVYDKETGVLLIDLACEGDVACVAKGGKGGRGNRRFASPTNRTPTEFEPGIPSCERWLKLELKLIADVGIVGLPNAGKSTLLSKLSRAKPKIAEYPFTTLPPHLGIAELSGHRRLILADMPGLIEGAHTGIGLGDEFLKHIERTKVILHLVDVSECGGGPAPSESYRLVRRELEAYSGDLARKPEMVVASKIDASDCDEAVSILASEIETKVSAISAVTGKGVPPMIERLWKLCQAEHKDKDPDPTAVPPVSDTTAGPAQGNPS